MSSTSAFMKIKDYIARHYGENVGKMLIHTGVIGWILSSAAQVMAIVINDKIPKEQKMFLIPQEIADAGVNIASFYLITQSFKGVASKLVNTGRWLPDSVRTFLSKNNEISQKVGKKGFDVLKDGKMPEALENDFKKFSSGIDVIATTIGSVLSCNIVTPIIRNEIAANRQKNSIKKMNSDIDVKASYRPGVKSNEFIPRPSMQAFQAGKVSAYPPQSGLKV